MVDGDIPENRDNERSSKESIQLKDMIGWVLILFGIIVGLLSIIVMILVAQGYFSQDEDIQKRITTADIIASNPKQAEEFAKNIRKNPKSSIADKAIAEAIFLQRKRKFVEAIQKWRAIAKDAEGKDNNLAASAWNSIGFLFHTLGGLHKKPKTTEEKYNQAILAHNKAIALNSKSAEAYVGLGLAKTGQKKYGAAIADFNKAIRLKPDFAEAYRRRGLAKFLRLKPEFSKVNVRRGLTKFLKFELEVVLKDFNKALHLQPDLAEAYGDRGALYIAQGNIEAALRDFKKARDMALAAGNKQFATQAEEMLRNLSEK